MFTATEVQVACGRFSTTGLKWEAIELVWLGWVTDLPLDICSTVSCWLACSHCHRNWVPECSGGSFCSGASKEEDRKERVRGRRRRKKRQREKEKQRVGEVKRERERGKVRHTVTGEYTAVTADWIRGSNLLLWASFFLLCSLLTIDFTAVLLDRLQVASLLADVSGRDARRFAQRCRGQMQSSRSFSFAYQSWILLYSLNWESLTNIYFWIIHARIKLLLFFRQPFLTISSSIIYEASF